MTAGVRARQRSRRAVWLLALAAGTGSLALAGQVLMQARHGEQRASGRVFPGLDGQFGTVREIRIQRPDGSFSLVRAPGGTGWVLPQRGGYPASGAAVDRLAAGLQRLELTARRTSDPAHYTRLGVGEPREGADGTGIELVDRSGTLIGAAVIGQRGAAVFVRRSGDPTVYLARPALPPLTGPAAFADLGVVQIGPEEIASVDIAAADGSVAIVRRPDGGLAPVGGRPNPAATATGIALSRFQPLDVLPRAEGPQGPPVARHVTLTRTGLSVSLGLWPAADGGALVAVRAEASPGDPAAVTAAQALNRRTGGWLYRLDASGAAEFMAPRRAVLGEAGAGADSLGGSAGTGAGNGAGNGDNNGDGPP